MSGLFAHWNSEKNCGNCSTITCDSHPHNQSVKTKKKTQSNLCLNPRKYEIVQEKIVGGCVIAKIKFDNCINFEGMKILVYDSIEKFAQLKRENYIDPHFSQVLYSPVARLEPTARGEQMAVIVANAINDDNLIKQENEKEIQRIIRSYEKHKKIRRKDIDL